MYYQQGLAADATATGPGAAPAAATPSAPAGDGRPTNAQITAARAQLTAQGGRFYGRVGSATNPMSLHSVADYNGYAKGTYYYDPDGQLRLKQ